MFDGRNLTLSGLAKIELPARTIRLCDGGQVIWGAETFRARDADFGTIAEASPFEEKTGDEAPGGRLTFLPKDTAAAATLSNPTYQLSRMRFWLAEVNRATGQVVGTPDLVADVLLDTTELSLAKGKRQLEIEYISAAERLFSLYEGNVLSPGFHKSVWPGERGFDNATGVPLNVPWGVKGPPRGAVAIGSGAGGVAGLVESAVRAGLR